MNPNSNDNDNDRDIGLFDSEHGYMFGLSYHINTADSIAAYWSCLGSAFRFLSTDMRDIWPIYFKKNDKTNKYYDPSTKYEQWNEFEDIPFERFHHITTLSQNLYKNNKDPFSWKQPKSQPISQPIKPYPNGISLEKQIYRALEQKYSKQIANAFDEIVKDEQV